MNIINTISNTRFSFNGIEYFKNYISVVRGNRIEIFNCYEREDVLLCLTSYNEISLNGTIHNAVSSLQSALQSVIYSRSTLAGEEIPFLEQNNTGRVINIGYLTGNLALELPTRINNLTTTLTASDSPVFFTGYQGLPQGSTKFTYQFLGGKGTWGQGGTIVAQNQLQQLIVQNLIPEDLTADENANIISLNEVEPSNFLIAANTEIRDFSNTVKQHYLSYSNNGTLYIKRFTGTPGEYGGSASAFTESDFEDITNSNIKAGPITASLEDILRSTGTVTVPFITKDENTGGKMTYKGSSIDYESADGFITKIDYENNNQTVNYKIPAKQSDDTFAMKSDIDHILRVVDITLDTFDELTESVLANFINQFQTININETETPPLIRLSLTEDPESVRLYQLLNIGKGVYGLNGVPLTSDNFIQVSAASDINDIISANNTIVHKSLEFIDEADMGSGISILDNDQNTLSRFTSRDINGEGREGYIFIGNSTASNDIKVFSDRILFNNGLGTTFLKAVNPEDNIELQFPDTSGTLAITSDLISSASFNAETSSVLDFKDTENNIVFSVSSEIQNISGLEEELTGIIKLSTESEQSVKRISLNSESPATMIPETVYFIETVEFEGSMTAQSDGVSTVIVFPHNLGTIPSYCCIQPKNILASGFSFVSADITNIIIEYASAISVGTPEYWVKYKK